MLTIPMYLPHFIVKIHPEAGCTARLVNYPFCAKLKPMAITILKLICLLHAIFLAACNADQEPIRINCGSDVDVEENGVEWEADRNYVGGKAYNVSNNVANSKHNLSVVDMTFRMFTLEDYYCYVIPIDSGRYLIRLSFFYTNNSSAPTFNVSLNGITVEEVKLVTQTDASIPLRPHITDYILTIAAGFATICLNPVENMSIINSIQILPQDAEAYTERGLTENVILSTYARINGGGAGFEDEDHRVWFSDSEEDEGQYKSLKSGNSIKETNLPPEHLPQQMFQSAREALEVLNFTGFQWNFRPLFPLNAWLIKLYFAELDPEVKLGDRIFHIYIGSTVISNFDIMQYTGSNYTAVSLSIVTNFNWLGSEGLYVLIALQKSNVSKFQPILNGIEVFEMVPTSDPSRNRSEQHQTPPYPRNGSSVFQPETAPEPIPDRTSSYATSGSNSPPSSSSSSEPGAQSKGSSSSSSGWTLAAAVTGASLVSALAIAVLGYAWRKFRASNASSTCGPEPSFRLSSQVSSEPFRYFRHRQSEYW